MRSPTYRRGVPSTLFHLGLGCLLAAALLDRVDRAVVGVVGAAVLVPELDTVAGLWATGAHRAWLNNVWLPLGLAALLVYDVAVREESVLRRWRTDGPRLAAVGIVVLAVAGIGGDLFYNGVNLLYPVHDQFYRVSGELYISTERGLVQTLTDGAALGSTDGVQYATGVDPDPSSDGYEPGAERLFPLGTSGTRLLVTVTGLGVLAYRLAVDR